MFRQQWTKAAALMGTLVLLGCGSAGEDVRAYSYNNPLGDVVVTVKVRNFGGAAGFVINEVHVAANGDDTIIAKLSHLSTWEVKWSSNDSATMCFIGTVDEGGAVWTRSVGGRMVSVRMDSTCADVRYPPLAEPRGVRFQTVTEMSGFRRDANFASRPLADIQKRGYLWHGLQVDQPHPARVGAFVLLQRGLCRPQPAILRRLALRVRRLDLCRRRDRSAGAAPSL